MDDHVIICRCQEITYGEIVQAIAEGATTVTGVKKRVGSGMGICQECRITVDGLRVLACQTLCRAGMQIERSRYAHAAL